MPLFILIAVFGVLVIIGLFLATNYERTVVANNTIETLQQQLTEALEEHTRLNERVQNLEAIVTSEAWDEWQAQQHIAEETLLPAELAPHEKAAQMSRRASRGNQ